MKRLPVEDLEHIYQNTQDIWESFRGKSIFVTGGTGFFGKWLLESFIYLNEKLALNAKITTLTRNPEAFFKEFPFYKEHANTVQFVKGDILNYDFNLNEIKKAFQEISKKYNFKKINNCLCFAREYVVLNGFNLFDEVEARIVPDESYDVVSLGVEVGNALMGNPVKTVPFVEAIKEVILLDKFVLHHSMLMNLKKKFITYLVLHMMI